jgi:hypothetical protein
MPNALSAKGGVYYLRTQFPHPSKIGRGTLGRQDCNPDLNRALFPIPREETREALPAGNVQRYLGQGTQ